MNPIVATALVGTARQGEVSLTTGTPVDTLIAALPEGEVERKLLLSAGALAMYRQAGQQSVPIASTPEPARSETLRACSPEAASVLARLFSGEQSELLPSALARVREVGLHLPYNLLPKALGTSQKAIRTALAPVLGERGLWLSQFNPSWDWARNYLPADQPGATVAETIWQEGTTAQRVEILSRVRVVDPDKAREWLTAVWKLEKADVRGEMLQTLEIGLSGADEAFLEKSLDDKAASVRVIAASLLARLPGTAFAERMRAAGSAMLFLQAGSPVIEPPTDYDKAWQRDGILENPPHKLGKRAWYLIQILSFIPPTYWETHLGAEPEALIEQIKTQQWGSNVLDGWSRAALIYDVPNWIRPLWNWWEKRASDPDRELMTDYMLSEKLFARLSGAETEAILLEHLRKQGGENGDHIAHLMSLFPGPWSPAFGHEYLRLFREHFASHDSSFFSSQQYNPYTTAWFSSLTTAALALPPACLPEAQAAWDLPDTTGWQATYMRSQLQNFVETIHMRQKIYEEII